MEVGILSMRYAKAMIEYAQEKGVEDKLYQEFLTLSYCFCAQPGLREALDNPVISTKEKLALESEFYTAHFGRTTHAGIQPHTY